MVSKPQAFPRRSSTLPEMKTLPFAGLRWILDASRFLISPSPRSRSLSRSRKHRQGVHRLHRSSLVDGLFKVCTCVSAIGFSDLPQWSLDVRSWGEADIPEACRHVRFW